ncbi:glycoside hydrolase N-terminal domain-containing protein [Cellulomonas sp. ATA003]|nr:glycoside hydrolase N-terminal domain-containing protein [Cellulomonas sp. ATA003]WNB86180.1 glycoside hydrolase N-terminal domain-containing protein [Cellulomonas sp. ATA003]
MLRAARAALADGDVREAERQVMRLQGGYVESYQPLVDLWLTVPDGAAGSGPATDYRRWLDLGEGTAGHTWSTGSGTVEQEVFVSRPAGVLVLHRTGTAPMDVDVAVTSVHTLTGVEQDSAPDGADWSAAVRMPATVLPDYVPTTGTGVTPSPGPGDGVTCAVGVRVRTDGRSAPVPGGVEVRGATWITVLLTSESDYADAVTPLHGDLARLRAVAHERLTAAADAGVPALREQHVADHGALFGRVALRLGPVDGPPQRSLPTADRLARNAETHDDLDLAALAFQYGRYLTIAGSRPGTLPLNLQGIWNESPRPPWSSNYTININTEMNYWPTLSTNLAECQEPLTRWLEQLAAAGRATARELYDQPGWTAHHNSDAWAFAEPVGQGGDNPGWSFWPWGGVWLTRHLVEHHDFLGDDAALLRAWPVIAGAVDFVLGWLVELPDGTLGTCPATSPENSYLAPDGRPAAATTSTTSDLAMARDLLESARRVSAVVLTGDPAAERQHAELVARIDAVLERLPTERVTADGRIAEWHLADLVEAEPEHRHQSHLYGVHPGGRIDPDQDPALAAAARASLDARGPESTGWSLAWRLNLRARLRDRRGAELMVENFLRPVPAEADHAVSVRGGGVYRSLLCAHPPFQIDGNFGFTAGVAELLVQSHRFAEGAPGRREIHLLPCLPPSWRDGAVRGLRARGGLVVDVEWSGGALDRAVLTADRDTTAVVRLGDATATMRLTAGLPVEAPLRGVV